MSPSSKNGCASAPTLVTSGFFDGAHSSASPVVPCAHDTMLRPPGGAGAVGTLIRPVTAMSSPCKDCEWYMTRYTVASCTSGNDSCCTRITSPGCPGGNGDGTT